MLVNIMSFVHGLIAALAFGSFFYGCYQAYISGQSSDGSGGAGLVFGVIVAAGSLVLVLVSVATLMALRGS